MIGWERSTKNERDVILDALAMYDARLVDRIDRAPAKKPDTDAEWRHYQVAAIVADLAGE